jgi:hypothetical protein
MPGGNSNHIRTYARLRGGIAIHNPNADASVPGGAYGTLGFIGTSDGADRWLVSCYHVLCRKNADFPPGAIEPIFHPVSQFEPAPVAVVSDARANRQLDCAAALLLIPGMALGQILGIGKLADPSAPAVGMRVIKSGAETGVTEGLIVKIVGDEVEIAPLGYTVKPTEYELSEGGDSGSLWIDAATSAPVAMHYRGSDRDTPERAFAKAILPVLNTLQLRVV